MTPEPVTTADDIIPRDLVDAARADQPAAPGAPAAAALPAVVNWTADSRELLDFALVLTSPLWPSLATVYTDEVRARLAEHIGKVFQKYDVTVAALLGRWAPELGLAMAALPLLGPTVQAIRADNAARRAPDPGAVAAPAAPGSEKQTSTPPAAPAAAPAGPSPLTRFNDAAQTQDNAPSSNPVHAAAGA